MNNIYDINEIHDNDVHNISELNLQHYLFHPSKCVKTIDSYYSLIIHGCINTHKSKIKYNYFKTYYTVDVVPRL